MGDWTSLEAIMRDLSVAQGSCVPASLETYTSNAPPAYNIEEEESEEQKYYTCDADTEASFAAPDLQQIQEMLRLVKESEANEDDNLIGSGDNLLQLEATETRNKIKLKKNAALSSIIAAKEAEEAKKHLIGDNIVQNMFKKKTVVNNEFKIATDTAPCPAPSLPRQIHKYTPSARAKEYYNKYEEQTKFRDQFKEDIWTKVERQMYEIDERQRRNTELVSLQGSDVTNTSPSSSASGTDIVNLPYHRHEIEADCVVCIVACKHGYNF